MKHFWENKRVLVTGHTGFKGSWLSFWLSALGADVYGLSLEPKQPNIFELCQLEKRMHSRFLDLRAREKVHSYLKEISPEIIIHLAAQSLVKPSYDFPVETYETNVMGSVHLYEAARECPDLKAILNVTTDKCYANLETSRGYTEEDKLGGYDPYSNSKACVELISQSYRSSFFNDQGVALATARAGNVVGGGDWADYRLVPDILDCIKNKTALTLRYPDAVRPWQHVLEPLAGYMNLSQRLYEQGSPYDEAWNFGPTTENIKSVRFIAEKLYEIAGQNDGPNVLCDEGPVQVETKILTLDSTKAQNKLNWKTILSIEETLLYTWGWFKDYLKGQDMTETTRAQIHSYTEKMGQSI